MKNEKIRTSVLDLLREAVQADRGAEPNSKEHPEWQRIIDFFGLAAVIQHRLSPDEQARVLRMQQVAME